MLPSKHVSSLSRIRSIYTFLKSSVLILHNNSSQRDSIWEILLVVLMKESLLPNPSLLTKESKIERLSTGAGEMA